MVGCFPLIIFEVISPLLDRVAGLVMTSNYDQLYSKIADSGGAFTQPNGPTVPLRFKSLSLGALSPAERARVDGRVRQFAQDLSERIVWTFCDPEDPTRYAEDFYNALGVTFVPNSASDPDVFPNVEDAFVMIVINTEYLKSLIESANQPPISEETHVTRCNLRVSVARIVSIGTTCIPP
jgi:hypothetical protein